MPVGEVGAAGVVGVGEDHLVARVGGVTSIGQELGDVLDVLATTPESILGAFVVAADEQGFAADHGEG